MAEQYYAYSSYNYSLNNPVSNTDPNGMWVSIPGGYETKDPDDIRAFFEDARGKRRSEETKDNIPSITQLDISKFETRSSGGDCGGPDQPPCLDILDPSQKFNEQFIVLNLLETYGILGGIRAVQRGVFNLASKLKARFVAKEAAKTGSNWIYGAFKSEAKWAGQLSKRGWTAEQITEAVTKGKSFDAVNMVNKANSATRYVHPTTGQSVVIDNVTKELLHVGGPGFKY